ncbi:hypothetical protein Cgig2_012559 [Carnegiea gigantea]|uniref:Aminotransferase-like plant mobile domain-containing protein n=1 Tax=Carnegiea gigantea TaxID=171969 RepID=A0A9Q1K2W5_9CARY|nr:hypothetical protein Cgig2_012559 [Carnegiea gigantea]
MGRENSQNETDESDSTYENKEGGSGMSSSSVSLEDEANTSSSGRLGVRCDQRKGRIEGNERRGCRRVEVRDMWDSMEDKRRSFAMDGHLVRAFIKCWNSDTKSFKIGRREATFSLYDVALIMGLPARGNSISFQCSEASSEVDGLLKGAMDDHVSCERGKRRTLQKVMRIYRNISVLLELCRSNNTRDKVGMFTKLYALLVVSGLLFPRCTGGVAWDLISTVVDVKSMAEYNWAEAM